MVIAWILPLLVNTTPLPFDAGLSQISGCPSGPPVLHFPVNIVTSGPKAQPSLSNDQHILLQAAVAWWNDFGSFFVYSQPPDPDQVELYLKAYPLGVRPTWHPFVQITTSDCLWTAVEVNLPDASAPDAFARYVHVLGDALGLAHDRWYTSPPRSIADPDYVNDTELNAGQIVLLSTDLDLLLDAMQL